MKKIFYVLTLILLMNAALDAQGIFNHFYLHGWTQNSGQVFNLSQWTNAKFIDWKTGPELFSYNSYNGMHSHALNISTAMHQRHTEGEYIGLGYSAGGPILRDVAQINACSALTGGGCNALLSGFITLDAPNNGASIADRWQWWLYKDAYASYKIQRGDASLFAFLDLLAGTFWSTVGAVIGSVVQNLWPMTLDLKPGSAYFTNLNSTSSIGLERTTVRGWVAVFGDIEASEAPHRGVRWRYPGFLANGDHQSIDDAQDSRQKAIDDANNNAWWHDDHANHLHGFWNVFARAWHRMRASDWRVSAQGWADEDDAWEWATADRQASDGFIAISSQIANSELPPVKINHNMNHGGAVVCGTASANGCPDGTEGANAVWHAMSDRLFLFHKPFPIGGCP